MTSASTFDIGAYPLQWSLGTNRHRLCR